jgi:hypothetical protein
MPRFAGGFVCGRGLHGCYVCNQIADFQCDAFVVPAGVKPRRRCNRYLCTRHRTNLATNKDACPEHAPACLAALERRAAQVMRPVVEAFEDVMQCTAITAQDAQWLMDELAHPLVPPNEPGDWKLCRGLGGQVQWLRAEDVPAWQAAWRQTMADMKATT